MAGFRIKRLNEQIREELADLLRRETEDPELQVIISIVEVDTAADLSTSKVYFSTLGDEDDIVRVTRRLRRAARFFRRELAARLNLRHTPELDFRPDESIARGARVIALLDELKGDQGGSGAQ